MPSVITDRTAGVTASQAIKVPVRAATTAAITLSAEQIVDGVAVAEGDRVLVKDQGSAVENGIYSVSTGTWTRAKDFNGARDVVSGTLILVASGGSTNGSTAWEVTSADPITIGTSNMTLARSLYADLPVPDDPGDDGKFLSANAGGTGWVAGLVASNNLSEVTPATARTNLAVPGLATANVFTKTQTWKDGGDIASGSALTLGDGNIFNITGTTTITSIITKGVGTVVMLRFAGILTLTHHATNLILFTAANLTTAAGDWAEFEEYAAGGWRMTRYSRSSGEPIVGIGKVLQVVQDTLTSSFTHTSTTMTDITGLSLSITPAATSSKILVMASIASGGASWSSFQFFQLMRDSTALNVGDAASSRRQVGAAGPSYGSLAAGVGDTVNMNFLDSPASVAALTYKVQVQLSGAVTGFINRSAVDTNSTAFWRGASSIIAIEIGA